MEDKRKIGAVTGSAVSGASISGALSVLVIYLIGELTGRTVPAELASVLPVLFSALGALIGGWLVKPGDGKRRAE